MLDLSYTFDALFAAVRITVWFWLLFVVIAPLFLEHIRDLPGIERMFYSWIGLGGTIIISILVLSFLHIYDFISIVLLLLFIPLIVDIIKNREEGLTDYFKKFELQTVVSHVKFIENYRGFSWRRTKESVSDWLKNIEWANTYTLLAFLIAAIGGITRMFAALQNASPFTRGWYLHLERIKNIRLQEYFTTMPEPGGMHSLVSLFSMLTQVSPEMILHLMGALTSFFLCIIVYWSTKDITKNEYPLAPLFAMSIYALVPMLFLPLSLDLQVEANTLDLALCFAIPTITIFVRNLRQKYQSPRFYILMGFSATALTNLFVAFVILLPVLLIASLTVPRKSYLRSAGTQIGYLLGISVLLFTPFVLYLLIQDYNILSFFREQLYDTRAYSYYPLLIAELPVLSQLYAAGAGIFLIGNLVRLFVYKHEESIDEIIVLLFFLVMSLIYLPQLSISTDWIDPDQLNGFYAVLISILFGLCFANILRFINWIIRHHDRVIGIVERVAFTGAVASLLYLQGGLQVSRVLPSTLPNGFFEAYYQIVDDYLPYSYATVGPEIDRTLSKNRHYFMNYDYFLNQYGSVDSLYHQWLSVPEQQRGPRPVPPPSIFIFVEKPPYGSIQQGILYNSGSVMRDVEQWIAQFRTMENRKVTTYFESPDVKVYEIVNREGKAVIEDVLLHVQPARMEGQDE
ncbi:hypothetical protein NC796_07685 [Aliifodinibius sp. S!AR15-10]|uniref:hypothetical protein n=1 Tax=Aliifodinibius sp. S!AR15-10 TaxID=2950437 RepID=UPI0028563171|nr:hypothetical protein [Aliifodinibius sp. S!AR15-10]MDR8391013.1 hypothetical protein [Aliifodinibius sp. S!AR15-10]